MSTTALQRGDGRKRHLYTANDLPVFQNQVFDSAEAARACARGDVVLVQDLATGLVYNEAFTPDLAKYDASYQNEQAMSPVFREHLSRVAGIIDAHFRGRKLIEIGCGKGYFLEILQSAGFDITGMDPTYEGTSASIVKDYFTKSSGLRAHAIVLRHVLEHVYDPLAFLANVRDANGGKGSIYIEVPCFDWTLRHRAWFDVFYEHVNYFRLADFHRMFERIESAGSLFGGQYLYVVAELAALREPTAPWGEVTIPKDFLATVDSFARVLQQRTSRAAIWGASSKGVVFSIFMDRAGAAVDAVIDVNPAKQNKFLPVTGWRIWSPDAAVAALPLGADILVMNGNYLPEIKELTQRRFNYLTVDRASI
jgi:hypothetical protein